MKALILVAAACIAYFVVFTWMFRILQVQKRVALLLGLWVASVPLFIVAYLITPATLGILPFELVDAPTWAGLVFGMLVYVAAFFGGLLQLYQLTERGD